MANLEAATAPAPPSRRRNRSAALALATLLISGFEGMRHYAYRDAVGVLTVCDGETHNVRFGRFYSTEECNRLLGGELEKYATGIEACVKADLPPRREAALISFAYNIGLGGACRSSVVVKINRGDVEGGCNALMAYDHAGGIVFPGLQRRRAKERELCLKG